MLHRLVVLSRIVVVALVTGGALHDAAVRAQTNSLLTTRQLTLRDSWIYIEPEPVPELKIHSLVTVVVDYRSQVISDAELERRRQANIKAILTDWIRLSGLDIKHAPQLDGDPSIVGTLNSRDKITSDLETRDGMKFTITCEVVDIRPNGNLVLDGQRMVENNDEQWVMSLSGIVRPEDVLPNNTVLSNSIAELHIDKRETGIIRDGYRRGWLLELIDRYRPL
ncbi:MAG: flagellar basal body L-ring protein FlgH [Pirellulales bacterium]|nr:flagellar basal body L-ring protein FlgH [Planctomycetales bacterium]